MCRTLAMFGRRGRWIAGVALFLAFALFSPRAAVAESPDASVARERAKAFSWFSSLGYPDVAKLPFVVAKLPNQDEYSGRWYPQRIVPAFLVSDGPKVFTIFTFDRQTQVVAKSASDAPPLQQAAYARADLNEYTRFVIDAVENDTTKQNDSGFSPRFGAPPSDGPELFVISWACARKGLDSLANDLFSRMTKPYYRNGYHGGQYNLVNLAIQGTDLEATRRLLSDEKMSRQEMLARCRRFAKMFPDSTDLPEINRYIRILAKMVAEDKQHAADRANGKPFDKLSRHDQIAELIFELRDQTGYQMDNCRQCNFFSSIRTLYEDDPDGTTPAHRLAKYGINAVPQLVEALSDERFCRAIETENHGVKEFNLTIGDCAERILAKILAHDFYPYYCMSHDGTAAQVRAAVNAWYADVLRRGEKQVLIQLVENDDNYDAATILAEKYPGDALEPIRIALTKNADRPWDAGRFIRAAAKIPGDSAIPFFQERAKEGKTLDERLAAAVALVKRDHPDGVVALVHEWGTADPSDQMFYSLILAILDSGQPDAIGGLADGMERQPAKVRGYVLDAIYRHDTVDSLFGVKDGHAVPSKLKLSPDQQRAMQTIIALLIQSLGDKEQINGAWTGDYSDKWVPNVRLCDVAGRDLNRLDPKRFAFNLEAPLADRDKARMAIIKLTTK